MSEAWKNRFWQLVLVCTFAVVLSVCNKALDSSSGGSKSSSSGIAYADFKPSDVSHILVCGNFEYPHQYNNNNWIYRYCDASNDDPSIQANLTIKNASNVDTSHINAIKFDTLAQNGWRFCGTSDTQYRFCK